jgi:hypothetical protein
MHVSLKKIQIENLEIFIRINKKNIFTKIIKFPTLKLLPKYKEVKAYKTVIIEIRTKLDVYFDLIQLKSLFSCDASAQSLIKSFLEISLGFTVIKLYIVYIKKLLYITPSIFR